MSRNPAYSLPAADRNALEQDRLTRQFKAIQEFIGDLSFAPIRELNPKTILELGSGTGVWAAEAADMFPGASVVAVDIVRPNPESIRPNIQFRTFDLRQLFPWEAESFDVVHTRLTLTHIPNARDVLSRILPLVKKGGLLILEDTLAPVHRFPERVPGFVEFWNKFQETMGGRGVDFTLPRSYVGALQKSRMYDDITCRVEFCTFSEGDDTRIGHLSAFSRKSFQESLLRHYPGSTPELIKRVESEMADPSVNKTTGYEWYFVWARRI